MERDEDFHREIFSKNERRVSDTGKFINNKRQLAITICVQDKESILDIIDYETHISNRNVSHRTGKSQASMHVGIRRNLLHPYRI